MLTELEAINQILSVTGDAPVSSINSTYEQAVIARRILLEVSKERQAKGYWFNEIDEQRLVRDNDGYIHLPSDTIRCEIPRDQGFYVQRGLRIFDKLNNTYVLTENLYVNLVIELPWAELPQSFRQVIVKLASIRYNSEYFGSDIVDSTLREDLFQKEINLQKEDIDNRDLNMIQSTRARSIAFRNRR